MFDWITNLINSQGYLAIILLMFLEDVFPPIPSELIMPMAGYTVKQGKLTLIGVIAAATIGSVLGSLPLYFLGKTVGEDRLKDWADKYGKWLTLSREDIEKAQGWFDRHGGLAVAIARLVPGVRSLIAVPAGIHGMNLPLFLLYTAIGAGIWSSGLAYVGVVLGNNYEKVEEYLSPVSYLVLGLVVLVYIVRVVKQHRAEMQPG